MRCTHQLELHCFFRESKASKVRNDQAAPDWLPSLKEPFTFSKGPFGFLWTCTSEIDGQCSPKASKTCIIILIWYIMILIWDIMIYHDTSWFIVPFCPTGRFRVLATHRSAAITPFQVMPVVELARRALDVSRNRGCPGSVTIATTKDWDIMGLMWPDTGNGSRTT